MTDQFKFSPWDEHRLQNWAESIGRYTREIVCRIFGSASIKEQDDNPSLAVLLLSNKYSESRLKVAYEYAIVNGIKRPRCLGEEVRAEAVVNRYVYTAFWIETGNKNTRENFSKNRK